uniref:Uncharacterized protein n=1 Tax=Moniliophthora roreri TaxID=221103 RepID=A0A0W0EZK2_MONRR
MAVGWSDGQTWCESVFLTTRIIVSPIATLSAMYFVYGLYILLFGTAFHLMYSRHRRQDDEWLNRKMYLSLTVVLFVLSTAFVVDYTIGALEESSAFFTAVKILDDQPLVDYSHRKTTLTALYFLIPILLNVTAEYMLIHRCYVIWGSRKRLAIPLLVASVLGNRIIGVIIMTVGGSVAAESGWLRPEDGGNDSNIASDSALWRFGNKIYVAYVSISLAVNSVLTLLTAGRIWWIHRQIYTCDRDIRANGKLIDSVSRIILESGLLYPTMSIIALTTYSVTTVDTFPLDFTPVMNLSAAIAPTLIIVRAKLGKNVESLQTQAQVSDICFTCPCRTTLREGTTTTRSISQEQVYSIGHLSMASTTETGPEAEQQAKEASASRIRGSLQSPTTRLGMSFSFTLPLPSTASTSSLSTPTSATATSPNNALTTVKQNEEQFMCIPVALQEGAGGKSFEEVRINDYIRSYSTTGRPPPPCPQEPKLPAERATRGLPPLFEPIVITKTANVNDLPEWQVVPNGGTSSTEGTLYSITAGGEYVAFSFEELRYHAYQKGNIHPPMYVPLSAFTPAPAPTSSSSPLTSISSATANGITYGGDTKETFMSISSKAEFALHSFEELRCAYMTAKREATSKEIMGGAPVPAPTLGFSFGSAGAGGGGGGGGGGGLFGR